MHGIYELKERLCDELEEYGKKEDLDVGTLDVVDKLSRTVKNLGKVIDKFEQSEYSYEGMNTGGMGGGDYSGNYSNARGGRGGRGGYSNARRRDSRGRYSRARGGNRSGGYSMDNNEMIQELKELMQDAPDDRTRQEFQSFIEKMERM